MEHRNKKPDAFSPIACRAMLGLTTALVLLTGAYGLVVMAAKPQVLPTIQDTTWKVDIHTATKPELQLLPGIGPTLARNIMEERRRAGFIDAHDLDRVKGIGTKTVERLAPYTR